MARLYSKTSVKTAGKPARIQLIADRSTIKADGKDLSYITARVLDEQGNMVPDADDLIKFELTGPGVIAGVDNGLQTSTEPFKANQHKAFNGLCLAIIQSGLKGGKIIIKASAKNLKPAILNIGSK